MRKIFLLFLMSISVTYAQNDLSGLKFCLDPGHGEYPFDKPYETRINLLVANFLKTYLEAHGAWVIVTRQDSMANVSLSQREYIANNNNVDFFHSIHHNAFNQNANYTLVLYEERRAGQPEWTGQADVMAQVMANYLYNYLYTTAKYASGDLSFLGYNLGVLNDILMPGVLSEASFWDYVPEIHRLNSLGYLKLEAFACLYAFLEYYEVPKRESSFIVGVVRDSEGENLPGINVTLTNGEEVMEYITDSQNIGVTPQDNSWSGFPYISEVKNGMYFFENFPSGPAKLLFAGEKIISDTLDIVVKDTTSIKVLPFLPISTNPPIVVSTIPRQGETNFSAYQNMIISFNKKMNRTSVEASFSVMPEASGDFEWSNNDKRMTFRTDTLSFETNYTITISGSAKDFYGYPLDGNGDEVGGDDFVLYFKTGPVDMFPPKLLTTFPSHNQTNIELLPIINITYDEPINRASITKDIFKLERYIDRSAVPGILENYVVNNQSTLCFFPSKKLFPNERYSVRINPGLSDLLGNKITSTRVFSFYTAVNDFEITAIDDFETDLMNNWLSPEQSVHTMGIINESTGRNSDANMINLLTQSKTSLQIKYGWDLDASSWFIRVYLNDAAAPKNIQFDKNYLLQVYLFGDGSGNQFRFCVDDNVPNYQAENHEVSPWYPIDWIGWKLVSWNLATDGTGTWLGDGQLDGMLRFDSIQLTYNPGNSQTGVIYFDDLRIVKTEYIGIKDSPQSLPGEIVLLQNYPNPFNPATTIEYQLPNGSHHVKLTVYDLLGKEIKTLINEMQIAGQYSIRWDGKDMAGQDVASGIYLCKLSAGYFVQTRRMVLMR